MRNNLKKIKQVLFLFATLLLASCSKDNFEENIQNPQNERRIKEYNFNDANKQNKFALGYSKIKTGLSKFSRSTSARESLPRDVNFTIDTTSITEITNGNIKTYTMLIKRPEFNNNYFENLVIKVDEQDSIKAYIATYFPEKNSQYHEEHDSYSIHGTSSIKEIEYDPSFFPTDDYPSVECVTVTLCSYGGFEHIAGARCENTYLGENCTFTGGGGGGTGSGSGGGGGTGGSTSGSGSGSAGSGSTTIPVYGETAPIVPWKNLNLVTVLSLTPTQATWINSIANLQIKKALQEYMYNNPANVSFGLDVINYSNNNSNTPEVLAEVNNIVNLLNNGLINGQPINYGDSTPITNMSQYLSCFNTTQGATLTISADQPISGEHYLFQGLNVGHSFITIQQGSKIRSLGFYPINGPQSGIANLLTIDQNDFINTPGEFHNNQSTSYDVSLSVPISAAQLTNVINGTVAVANSNPSYNLSTQNCTDVAILLFESNTNVNLPNCESPNILWDGQTPGTLGEIIRNFTILTGGTKNTNGGISPQNNG